MKSRLILPFAFIFLMSALIYFNKPLIKEIKIETIASNTGSWIVLYRYSIDGLEQSVFLYDEAQLLEYKAYLRRVGRFTAKKKDKK